jgi:hypothetical protein
MKLGRNIIFLGVFLCSGLQGEAHAVVVSNTEQQVVFELYSPVARDSMLLYVLTEVARRFDACPDSSTHAIIVEEWSALTQWLLRARGRKPKDFRRRCKLLQEFAKQSGELDYELAQALLDALEYMLRKYQRMSWGAKVGIGISVTALAAALAVAAGVMIKSRRGVPPDTSSDAEIARALALPNDENFRPQEWGAAAGFSDDFERARRASVQEVNRDALHKLRNYLTVLDSLTRAYQEHHDGTIESLQKEKGEAESAYNSIVRAGEAYLKSDHTDLVEELGRVHEQYQTKKDQYQQWREHNRSGASPATRVPLDSVASVSSVVVPGLQYSEPQGLPEEMRDACAEAWAISQSFNPKDLTPVALASTALYSAYKQYAEVLHRGIGKSKPAEPANPFLQARYARALARYQSDVQQARKVIDDAQAALARAQAAAPLRTSTGNHAS